MELRTLGRTGIKVSPLCLGAMMFGKIGNPDHDDAVKVIHTALDAGINFVDTADVYSAGESEEIVGKALAGRRDAVVLATKVHGQMGTDPNRGGNSRRWITKAVDESLTRLGTDWIDLYQVHRPDPSVPLEETLGALSDLVHAGKIRAFGTSTYPARHLEQAQWLARRDHLVRPSSEQPPYSIFVRGIEADVLPVCVEHDVAVLSWSPLNGGWLSGRYRKGSDEEYTSARTKRREVVFDLANPVNQQKKAAAEALAELADEAGISVVHLAVAWVIRHPGITSAIIGPRTLEQLESQVGAADVALSNEVLDRIDEIVPPGVDLNRGDSFYENPALTKAARRR